MQEIIYFPKHFPTYVAHDFIVYNVWHWKISYEFAEKLVLLVQQLIQTIKLWCSRFVKNHIVDKYAVNVLNIEHQYCFKAFMSYNIVICPFDNHVEVMTYHALATATHWFYCELNFTKYSKFNFQAYDTPRSNNIITLLIYFSQFRQFFST